MSQPVPMCRTGTRVQVDTGTPISPYTANDIADRPHKSVVAHFIPIPYKQSIANSPQKINFNTPAQHRRNFAWLETALTLAGTRGVRTVAEVDQNRRRCWHERLCSPEARCQAAVTGGTVARPNGNRGRRRDRAEGEEVTGGASAGGDGGGAKAWVARRRLVESVSGGRSRNCFDLGEAPAPLGPCTRQKRKKERERENQTGAR
ncbi:hypothetical protein JCGZ_14734 [Jatropha curcas]|uniref:Uncharacterized protein n=1 Tax=Jatropha curcas TaxID=180498 RepID=A0A067K8G2_JATCU|nr:hypothetical protein JCGZ_14734 [Jatropha curcas]